MPLMRRRAVASLVPGLVAVREGGAQLRLADGPDPADGDRGQVRTVVHGAAGPPGQGAEQPLAGRGGPGRVRVRLDPGYRQTAEGQDEGKREPDGDQIARHL